MYENQFRENLKDKRIAFINGIQLTLFIIITNNAYENQLGELLKKKILGRIFHRVSLLQLTK